MGNNNSSSVTQTLDAFNSITANLLSSTTNTTAQNIQTQQNLDLSFGCPNGFVPTINCKNLNVTQNAQVTADFTSSFTSNNASQIAASLQSAIETAAASSNKIVNGFLNTAIGNSTSSNTTVKDSIKNIINTNIQQIVNSTCIQNTSVIQNGKISVCANLVSDNCSIGQTLQLYLIANCMANSIISAVSADANLSKAISNAAAANDVKNVGLDSIIASILGFFQSALFIYAALILGVLIILFFLVKFLLGGGEGSGVNSSLNNSMQNYLKNKQP